MKQGEHILLFLVSQMSKKHTLKQSLFKTSTLLIVQSPTLTPLNKIRVKARFGS